nr:hypothetical protein [Sinirhodobacter populi]
MSDTFGPRLPASYERSNLTGSFSKTSPDSSPLAVKPCCESYGKWAGRLRAVYSARAKQARRTNASASSLWPTATANSFAQTAENPAPGQTGGTTLAGAAERIWSTPRASDAEKGGPNQKFGAGGIPLPAQAAQWTTPSASDNRRSGTITDAMSGTSLAQQVNTLWPTPAARDHKGENGPAPLVNGTGRLHMDQLPNAAAHGFTRPDLPIWTGGGMPSPHAPISRPL